MKAYSYIRFSTPEQKMGDSLRRQLEASRQYAAQHGLDLDESLRDEGVSAFRGDHRRFGALSLFLAQVENGHIPEGSLLIVENLDRLSRESIDEALSQFMSLLRAGIEIVTLSDCRHYDRSSLSNLTDLIITLSGMARAHGESARKSELNGAAWSKKRRDAAEGKPMTALCPFWLRLRDDRGGFDVIPEYVEIVRSMFTDTIRGIGRRTIAIKLNELDVEPRRWGTRQAKRWHMSLITKTLNNRAVLGEMTAAGEVMPGHYPAIIDEATFYQAQQAAASRRISGGRRGKSFSNVLTGMCRCIECGGTVRHQNKGRGTAYLFCDNHHMESGCSNKKRWRYDLVEIVVLALLAEHVDWAAVYGGNDDGKRSIEVALTAERGKLERAERARDRFEAIVIDSNDAVLDEATQAWKKAVEDVSLIKNAIKKCESELAAYIPAARQAGALKQAIGRLLASESYDDRAHVNSLLKAAGLELIFSADAVTWRIGEQSDVLISAEQAKQQGAMIEGLRNRLKIVHMIDRVQAFYDANEEAILSGADLKLKNTAS